MPGIVHPAISAMRRNISCADCEELVKRLKA